MIAATSGAARGRASAPWRTSVEGPPHEYDDGGRGPVASSTNQARQAHPASIQDLTQGLARPWLVAFEQLDELG